MSPPRHPRRAASTRPGRDPRHRRPLQADQTDRPSLVRVTGNAGPHRPRSRADDGRGVRPRPRRRPADRPPRPRPAPSGGSAVTSEAPDPWPAIDELASMLNDLAGQVLTHTTQLQPLTPARPNAQAGNAA